MHILIRFFYIVLIIALSQDILSNSPVEYSLSQKRVNLGDTLRLDIRTQSPIKKSFLTLAGKSFTLFKRPEKSSKEHAYVAYFAVPRTRPSGDYKLKLFLKLEDKTETHFFETLYVHHPKTKILGKVTLSETKKTLSKNTNDIRKEASIIGKKFNTKTDTGLFKGWFMKPSIGRISSPFGKERLYNSGIRRMHSGTDIANSIGTPVFAPNNGIIILSQSMSVHGNTIMIDHGYGIITIYNHLDTRLVEEGATINKGDMIGTIGQTGLASGPHLHWGLSVQNIRVDPLKWVKVGD